MGTGAGEAEEFIAQLTRALISLFIGSPPDDSHRSTDVDDPMDGLTVGPLTDLEDGQDGGNEPYNDSRNADGEPNDDIPNDVVEWSDEPMGPQ